MWTVPTPPPGLGGGGDGGGGKEDREDEGWGRMEGSPGSDSVERETDERWEGEGEGREVEDRRALFILAFVSRTSAGAWPCTN